MVLPVAYRETIKNSSHYYWGCCLVCAKKSSPENPMKRCSRCKCVFYCSQEHQKQHWREHKDLCKFLANPDNTENTFELLYMEDQTMDNMERLRCFSSLSDQEKFNFFSSMETKVIENWIKFREAARTLCTFTLARPLSRIETEIFFFPRACRTCNCSKNTMYDCEECYCVSYCSLQHKEEHQEYHKTMCRSLRIAMAIHIQLSKNGFCLELIPQEFKYMGSSPDITHLLPKPIPGNNDEISKPIMDHCLLTCHLSGVLTILHCIHKFRPELETKKNLNVHVVGATQKEIQHLKKWEYLLHNLPEVKSITYHFIGPEIGIQDQPDVPCFKQCIEKNKSISYTLHKLKYGEYKKKDSYEVPDVILLQNPGFWEFEGAPPDSPEYHQGWVEGWADIPSIVPATGCLTVYTSYNAWEAKRDLKIVDKYCDVNVLASGENPMRSHLPLRSYARTDGKDVYYSNQYYTVLECAKK